MKGKTDLFERTQHARRIASYRRRRTALIEKLGGACVDCGDDDHAKLEFDHKTVRTWVARKVSRWQRIANYWREAERGEIELRCSDCNKRKGQPNGDTHTHTHTDGATDF